MSEIWLSGNDRTAIEAEARQRYPLETGGVLMGYWSGDAAVVTAVIGPGPQAKHERLSFFADHDWQTARVAEHYAASGRLETYLGDWHTHPDGPAMMSSLDRAALRLISSDAEARAPRALMMIFAGRPDRWQPAAWSGPDAVPVVIRRAGDQP